MKKTFVTAAVLVAASGVALAGGDLTFDLISGQLTEWAQGSLGKVVAIAMFIVGLGAGIVKQSVMAIVAGIGAAIILNYGPGVINGMFTATI